jgi:hypothetical protein
MDNTMDYHAMEPDSFNRTTYFSSNSVPKPEPTSTVEEDTVTVNPMVDQSVLLLTSSAFEFVHEDKKYRSQWTWGKYLRFICPLLYTTPIYVSQVVYGVLSLATNPIVYLSLGTCNLIAGILGLISVTFHIYNNWFYIKPSWWLTEEEYIEEPKPWWWKWVIFFIGTILDGLLYIMGLISNVLTVSLFLSDQLNSPWLLIFTALNIMSEGVKYISLKIIVKYLSPTRWYV